MPISWIQVLIDFVIGIASAVTASLVTYFLINRFFEKKATRRKNLLNCYIFFRNLEMNFDSISNDDLSKGLVLYRTILKNEKDLNASFSKVDIGLSTAIRLNKSGGKASYSFNGEDYLEFIYLLEKEIG